MKTSFIILLLFVSALGQPDQAVQGVLFGLELVQEVFDDILARQSNAPQRGPPIGLESTYNVTEVLNSPFAFAINLGVPSLSPAANPNQQSLGFRVEAGVENGRQGTLRHSSPLTFSPEYGFPDEQRHSGLPSPHHRYFHGFPYYFRDPNE
eukprot:GILI01021123.1.p1 GENE.GILI01021123.1~~GILI01021123.1.p1  ORF type:complete len:151 (-),score=15.82 GILI01021123.1:68-520(-)